MSTHDCNVTSWQNALPERSNTNKDILKGQKQKEIEEKLQMISVQSRISQRQHSFFPSAMTIKSHPRLFSAKKKLCDYFCQIKFPSREMLQQHKSWIKLRVIKRVKCSQLNFMLLFLQPRRCGKSAQGKFQRHLLYICHLLGNVKTSFQHCNLYLESSGCVPPSTVFSFCCSLCFLYSANYLWSP